MVVGYITKFFINSKIFILYTEYKKYKNIILFICKNLFILKEELLELWNYL